MKKLWDLAQENQVEIRGSYGTFLQQLERGYRFPALIHVWIVSAGMSHFYQFWKLWKEFNFKLFNFLKKYRVHIEGSDSNASTNKKKFDRDTWNFLL